MDQAEILEQLRLEISKNSSCNEELRLVEDTAWLIYEIRFYEAVRNKNEHNPHTFKVRMANFAKTINELKGDSDIIPLLKELLSDELFFAFQSYSEELRDVHGLEAENLIDTIVTKVISRHKDHIYELELELSELADGISQESPDTYAPNAPGSKLSTQLDPDMESLPSNPNIGHFS